MWFRLPRFLRRFIRRRMRPVKEEKAMSMNTKLSIAYAIIAWHGAGYVAYQVFYKKNVSLAKKYGITDEYYESLPYSQQWAVTLGINKGAVFKIDGLNVTKQDDINLINEDKLNQISDSGSTSNPKTTADLVIIDKSDKENINYS